MNQEIKDTVPPEGAVFGAWLSGLTDRQKANVTTARRAGYIVMTMLADGTTTVTKGTVGA